MHEVMKDEVKFYCNACDHGVKTDSLVMVTIRGRDHLLCERCSYKFMHKDKWETAWKNNQVTA